MDEKKYQKKEKHYSKLAKKWYKKFTKIEKENSEHDIVGNQDKAILLAMLYSVLHYKAIHVGYPGWIDPEDIRSVKDNMDIWNDYLDSLINDLIFIVEEDTFTQERQEAYRRCMNKMVEVLPALWV